MSRGPARGPRRARPTTSRAIPRSPQRIILTWVLEFLVYVVIALVVMSLVRAYLIAPFNVPTGSMQQTIELKDTIVAWRPGAPVRGEIVVFEDDLNWLPPLTPSPWWKRGLSFVGLAAPTDKQYLVKRLIGLPGDHVVCCDTQGRVSVNGQALDESSYLYQTSPGETVAPSTMAFDIVVPDGRMFVMGDHRNYSADSRFHTCNGNTATPEIAFPALSSIQGRAVAIISPISRWRAFSIPPDFANIPPPAGKPPSVHLAQWTCPNS